MSNAAWVVLSHGVLPFVGIRSQAHVRVLGPAARCSRAWQLAVQAIDEFQIGHEGHLQTYRTVEPPASATAPVNDELLVGQSPREPTVV